MKAAAILIVFQLLLMALILVLAATNQHDMLDQLRAVLT